MPRTFDVVVVGGGQVARRMPSFSDAALVDSWVGAYDITPDWNPVLGKPERWEQLVLAYGFSGHGFKLAQPSGGCWLRLCWARRRMSTSPPTITGASMTAPFSREPTGSDRFRRASGC